VEPSGNGGKKLCHVPFAATVTCTSTLSICTWRRNMGLTRTANGKTTSVKRAAKCLSTRLVYPVFFLSQHLYFQIMIAFLFYCSRHLFFIRRCTWVRRISNVKTATRDSSLCKLPNLFLAVAPHDRTWSDVHVIL